MSMAADLDLHSKDLLYLQPPSDSNLKVKSETQLAMASAQDDLTYRASGVLNGCLPSGNRDHQRINFELRSDMFERWCQVRTDKGLTSDSQIASFLLDQYNRSETAAQSRGVCFHCNAPLTLMCAQCNSTPKQHASHLPAKHTDSSETVPALAEPGARVKSQTDTTSQRKRRGFKSSQPAAKKRKVRSRRRVASVTNTASLESDNDLDDIAVSFGQVPLQGSDANQRLESPNISQESVKIETDADEVADFLHHVAETESKKPETKSRKHRKGNKGRVPILCPECPSTFTRKSDLEKHVRKHTGERPFKCSLCPAAYTQNNNLKFHIQSQHTGERPWVCDECGVSCIRKCDLKVHMLKHSGERPYVCSQCNTSFTQKGALRVHMRIHTNDRPYLCKECGAAFRQEGNLQRHMRRHTGERPYRCSKCQATFAETGTLKIHMRRHTGDRPYVCDICAAAFTAQGALTIHRRSHTGHRPYVCQDCGAKFTHNGGLRRHERTHTGAKPHMCSHCGTAFAESYALKTHIRKVHSSGDESRNVSLETVENSLMVQMC